MQCWCNHSDFWWSPRGLCFVLLCSFPFRQICMEDMGPGPTEWKHWRLGQWWRLIRKCYFSPWREGDCWESLSGCGIFRGVGCWNTLPSHKRYHGSVTLRHGPEAEALGLKYSAGIWLTHDKEVYQSLGSASSSLGPWVAPCCDPHEKQWKTTWESSGTVATTSGRTNHDFVQVIFLLHQLLLQKMLIFSWFN